MTTDQAENVIQLKGRNRLADCTKTYDENLLAWRLIMLSETLHQLPATLLEEALKHMPITVDDIAYVCDLPDTRIGHVLANPRLKAILADPHMQHMLAVEV